MGSLQRMFADCSYPTRPLRQSVRPPSPSRPPPRAPPSPRSPPPAWPPPGRRSRRGRRRIARTAAWGGATPLDPRTGTKGMVRDALGSRSRGSDPAPRRGASTSCAATARAPTRSGAARERPPGPRLPRRQGARPCGTAVRAPSPKPIPWSAPSPGFRREGGLRLVLGHVPARPRERRRRDRRIARQRDDRGRGRRVCAPPGADSREPDLALPCRRARADGGARERKATKPATQESTP